MQLLEVGFLANDESTWIKLGKANEKNERKNVLEEMCFLV